MVFPAVILEKCLPQIFIKSTDSSCWIILGYYCTVICAWRFLVQVQLRQKTFTPQVQPDSGSNSWPPHHESTFHVTWDTCSNYLAISDFLHTPKLDQTRVQTYNLQIMTVQFVLFHYKVRNMVVMLHGKDGINMWEGVYYVVCGLSVAQLPKGYSSSHTEHTVQVASTLWVCSLWVLYTPAMFQSIGILTASV